MSSKDFEAGMAADAKIQSEKYDQLGEKVEHTKKEIGEKLEDLHQDIGAIYGEIEYQDQLRQLGLSDDGDISRLEENERQFLISALYQLAETDSKTHDLQQSYLAAIAGLLGVWDTQPVVLENVEKITDLGTQKCLLTIVLEYIYLKNNGWALTEEERNFIDHFQVNAKTRKSIEAKVERTAGAIGLIGLSKKYDRPNNIGSSASNDVQPDTEGETQAVSLPEDGGSSDRYTKLKHIIGGRLYSIFPSEQTAQKQKTQEKRSLQFKEKYAPSVVDKTIIGVAETVTQKFLFTTSGMYFIDFLKKDPVFLRYSKIDVDRTQINLSAKNGRPESLVLVTEDEQEKVIINSPGVNYSELSELFTDLKAISTAERDTAITVSEMPRDAKVVYSQVLIQFCQERLYSMIDALRLIYILDPNLVKDMLTYSQAEHNRSEILDQLSRFKSLVPYPSEEAAASDLICSLVKLVQFSTGNCRSITAAEREYISCISQVLEMNRELLDGMIQVYQIHYRILKSDITKKEISSLIETPVTIAASLAGGILGFMAVDAIVDIINSYANKQERAELYQEVEQSYTGLLSVLDAEPDEKLRKKLRGELIQSATRSGINIPKNTVGSNRAATPGSTNTFKEKALPTLSSDGMAIETIVKKYIYSMTDKWDIYIREDFPENMKKLDFALKMYARTVKEEEVIAFIDTTLLDDGGAGLMFSETGVAFGGMRKHVFMKYSEIKSIKKNSGLFRNLEFAGHFSAMDEPDKKQTLTESLNHDAIKLCIEEIQAYIRNSTIRHYTSL